MAPTLTYIITFDRGRIGHVGGVDPLDVNVDAAQAPAAVAADLVVAIRDHARRYLFSWGFQTNVDLSTGRGSITRDGTAIATFEITSPSPDRCRYCGVQDPSWEATPPLLPTGTAPVAPSPAAPVDLATSFDVVEVRAALEALMDLREALQALSTARRVGALPAALEIVQAAHTRTASLVDRLLTAAELDAHPERSEKSR